MDDLRFDSGLYSVREAARLARVPAQSLMNWIRGYTYPTLTGPVRARPIIRPTAKGAKPPALSFVNLMEAVALAGFRQAGVPMQRVRRALVYVAKAMEEPHPLVSERVRTDGLDLFWEYQSRGSNGERALIDLVHGGQKVFPEAVERYLRQIEWGPDAIVARWWIAGERAKKGSIVVDPKRAFGAPVIAGTGIRTEDVFDRFSAGEPIEELALDYGLTFDKVEAAIRTEARLLEPLAA